MLSTIVAVVALMATTSTYAQSSRTDSVSTLRNAKRAQADFEARRYSLLPEVGTTGHRCDVVIGRFCYWVDDDVEHPAEPARIAKLRDALLSRLAAFAAASPGDRWIAGQRVRYLVEAGRFAESVDAARACRAAASWCASLAALAFHALGDVRAADSAVTAALDAMTEQDRCAASDIEPLLDGALRERFHKASCAERDSLAARWWWLAQPLYLADGNPLRAELFARRTLARLAAESRSPYIAKGKDVEATILRYGWPVAWGRTRVGLGTSLGSDNAVGFDPKLTLAFGPDLRALDDVSTVGDETYHLTNPQASARFSPASVTAIGAVRRHVATFRRGDSTLVVAAFDAEGDTAMAGAHDPVPALVLLRDEHTPSVVVRGSAGRHGVLTATAPWRPQLVAVEMLDTATRRSARSRDGLAHRDTVHYRVELSDLLLFAAEDSVNSFSLDGVASRALASGRLVTGTRLGLFWEMYGVDANERVTATVGLVPVESGLLRRLAERARLASPRSAVHLQWSDAPEVRGSIGGRALVLDLGDIPTGRYTVELSLSVDGQPALRAESGVEVVSP
jgi:hypothetical protein